MTTSAELQKRIRALEERDTTGTVIIFPGCTVSNAELKNKQIIRLADNPEDYV